MLDETAAHVLGGGIGGTVGAICTCPLELVKTRFQSSQGNSISGSCSSRPPSSATMNLASSSVLIRSAQTAAITTQPSAKFDVTRIPTNLPHKSISFSPQFCKDFLLRSKIIQCMRDVCRTEGYRALFKGLVPTLVGVLPSRCIYFCAYHEGQKFFQQYFPEGHSAVFMLAAGCGSITASTVTNPIWYIKTRLQLDSRPKAAPVTVWDIIKSTYREYGLRGFYRGISASYIGSLETALNFVVYEHVKGTLLFWGQKRNRQTEMAAIAAEDGVGNWEECANGEVDESGQCFRGSQGGSKLSANSDMIICMGASALSKFVAITASYPHVFIFRHILLSFIC
ncbi:unnamed protein product [Rodentolepis nana]|uniref:Mitochondrial carrier protein n=1 Tax=Rodentolepis nana TaxID=102285 RepID=A0A0R3T4C2_RODNA|nr:unnamed protein product [Rodentolepis nana]